MNIGKDDTWGYKQSKKIHEWLNENEVQHTFMVSDGGHEWDVWRKDMIVLLPTLFKR